MDDMQLIIDLHKRNSRQGPGSATDTQLAVTLAGLAGQPNLRLADIGCGTGAATLVLAAALDAHITAVDFLPDFLEVLQAQAASAGLAGRITTLAASMAALPFEAEELDGIWAEGAIYNMGFEAGIAAWRPFLKPGGVLAVSELTWLTAERPADLQAHWDAEYPEVATASAKLALLEQHGYTPLGYFPLPPSSWLDHYYRPLQAGFSAFLDAHGHSEAATAIVAAEQAEIDLYERNQAFVSYGYYVARKVGA